MSQDIDFLEAMLENDTPLTAIVAEIKPTYEEASRIALGVERAVRSYHLGELLWLIEDLQITNEALGESLRLDDLRVEALLAEDVDQFSLLELLTMRLALGVPADQV